MFTSLSHNLLIKNSAKSFALLASSMSFFVSISPIVALFSVFCNFFTIGFEDGFSDLEIGGFIFHSAFLAVPISKTGKAFVLFLGIFPFVGLLGIFGSILFFHSFSNIALIMLFGSFFDFINLPTAFDAIPRQISATPHRTSPISILPPPLTILPAHSIAPIESTNPHIFCRLNTISRATVSP